jgi:hypothetical protein
MGEKTLTINVYKTLLEDIPHTAGKVASLMEMAISTVIKLPRECKSTGQTQLLQRNTQKKKIIINDNDKSVKGDIRRKSMVFIQQ